MSCVQCHGCAYKSGAIANQEAHNRLRGIFAALGGIAFFCHESMGWTTDADGYPHGSELKLSIIILNHAQSKGSEHLFEGLRSCGGWKSAVARLHEQGWFQNREIAGVRRTMAQMANHEMSTLDDAGLSESVKDVRLRNIGETLDWFAAEAQASGIDIGFLFEVGAPAPAAEPLVECAG